MRIIPEDQGVVIDLLHTFGVVAVEMIVKVDYDALDYVLKLEVGCFSRSVLIS